MRTGLRLATGLGGIATVVIAINALQARTLNAVLVWPIVMVFYLVFGFLRGALFGLLRPLGNRYVGRLLIAYLLLMLVYAGGTVAFYPLIAQRPNPPSLAELLIAWAVLSLILAPFYVAMVKGSALPSLWDSSQE
jgi:hypothetical protein